MGEYVLEVFSAGDCDYNNPWVVLFFDFQAPHSEFGDLRHVAAGDSRGWERG